MSLLDVRLVVDRHGVVRARLEGRAVALPGAPRSYSAALHELARMLDGVAWSSARDEADEVGDAASPLYTGGRS